MPWQKGQSGNPNGAKRVTLANGMTLRDMARSHTDKAIKALVKVMSDEASTDAAVIGAAVALLDRGWGKPAQSVEITGAEGGPIETLDVGKAPADVLRWIAAQQSSDEAASTH
jgi:2-keto-4-pentenoate hydratase